MSADSFIDGQIDIEPPIPLSDIPANSPHLASNHHGFYALNPLVEVVFELDTDPDTGQRAAIALVPAVTYGRKLGNPAAEIQDIIDAHGSGRIFSGELDVETVGGGRPDYCRVIIRDGRAVWDD
ncbi:DUF6205 family protein [Nonomuraea typhae]|uniref:DUF6205 family protein n=1 Tax=Nonomuraea typhae TaxID=2603600 RepID=UPI0012FAF531|nr:DUF6205 family protein [Nonomuraea typhae]